MRLINCCIAKRQTGSALLSALFMVTLVAIAATAMALRLQLDIYRTQLATTSDKLTLASQVVSFWAMSLLSNPNFDFKPEKPTGPLRVFPRKASALVPGYTVTGYLVDLQGSFNINNLTDVSFYPIFLRLLANIKPPLSREEQQNFIEATQQWLAPYTPGRNNPLTAYYAKQNPPYYMGNQLFAHLSEIRLLPNVSPARYRLLSQYLVALPKKTAINLYTAQKSILMALGPNLTTENIEALLEKRNKGELTPKNLSQISRKYQIKAESITLESQYFLSVGIASSSDGKTELARYTVLKRETDDKKKLSLSVIQESFNAP